MDSGGPSMYGSDYATYNDTIEFERLFGHWRTKFERDK